MLYTITNKDVDNKTLMLRMSFRNLRFSRCLFCNSVSVTKRAFFFFLFILYVPFRRARLTLANIGISCSFFKPNVGNQFFKLCFLLFEISNNFNQIMPMLLLNMFENIISGIKLYNKTYHWLTLQYGKSWYGYIDTRWK